jgi:hypothetical protein
MNIGNFFISPANQLFHGLELVGAVVRFDFRILGANRSGHLSMRLCESSVAPLELARHFALNGITVSIDVFGEFWPNSYIKADEWYFEGEPGVITYLGIKAQRTYEEEVFDESLTGVY